MDAMGYAIGFHTALCCEPKVSSIRLQENLDRVFWNKCVVFRATRNLKTVLVCFGEISLGPKIDQHVYLANGHGKKKTKRRWRNEGQ